MKVPYIGTILEQMPKNFTGVHLKIVGTHTVPKMHNEFHLYIEAKTLSIYKQHMKDGVIKIPSNHYMFSKANELFIKHLRINYIYELDLNLYKNGELTSSIKMHVFHFISSNMNVRNPTVRKKIFDIIFFGLHTAAKFDEIFIVKDLEKEFFQYYYKLKNTPKYYKIDNNTENTFLISYSSDKKAVGIYHLNAGVMYYGYPFMDERGGFWIATRNNEAIRINTLVKPRKKLRLITWKDIIEQNQNKFTWR